MRKNNFVGAAWRALQEGGFAVELSLLVGCGLKTHDVNPNEVWTSEILAKINPQNTLLSETSLVNGWRCWLIAKSD
jgi:hypothetical protein